MGGSRRRARDLEQAPERVVDEGRVLLARGGDQPVLEVVDEPRLSIERQVAVRVIFEAGRPRGDILVLAVRRIGPLEGDVLRPGVGVVAPRLAPQLARGVVGVGGVRVGGRVPELLVDPRRAADIVGFGVGRRSPAPPEIIEVRGLVRNPPMWVVVEVSRPNPS